MASGVSGVRTTGRGPSANALKIDMSEKIHLLDPDRAPFLRLISAIGKKPADQPKFMWSEDVVAFEWDVTTAQSLPGDTTIDVANGAYFKANDVVVVPRTNEIMRVVSIAANVLTVVRGIGDKTAAALINAAEPLLIVGSAYAEAAAKGAMISTSPAEKYNYCQINKDLLGLSETLIASKTITDDELVYQRAKKGKVHAERIEKMLLFGERGIVTGTTTPQRTSGGLLYFINTNVMDAGGVILNEDLWNAWLETLFAHGSSSKVVLASAELIRAINGWGLDLYDLKSGDSEMGLNISSYLCPFGKVSLVYDKQMVGATYGKMGIGVDLENVKYRVLRDTAIEKNVQASGDDAYEEEYKTESGLEVVNEETCALLKNFVAA